MRTLLHTEFAALLARADVSQAALARISGYTPRQVRRLVEWYMRVNKAG